MDLKINRDFFKGITNKDWILDNGACYQCVTLKHRETSGSPYYIPRDCWTVMGKKQFNDLLKKGLIVRFEELEQSEKFKERYSSCKAYRFNVEE